MAKEPKDSKDSLESRREALLKKQSLLNEQQAALTKEGNALMVEENNLLRRERAARNLVLTEEARKLLVFAPKHSYRNCSDSSRVNVDRYGDSPCARCVLISLCEKAWVDLDDLDVRIEFSFLPIRDPE